MTFAPMAEEGTSGFNCWIQAECDAAQRHLTRHEFPLCE
jgi:hypothetical protein